MTWRGRCRGTAWSGRLGSSPSTGTRCLARPRTTHPARRVHMNASARVSVEHVGAGGHTQRLGMELSSRGRRGLVGVFEEYASACMRHALSQGMHECTRACMHALGGASRMRCSAVAVPSCGWTCMQPVGGRLAHARVENMCSHRRFSRSPTDPGRSNRAPAPCHAAGGRKRCVNGAGAGRAGTGTACMAVRARVNVAPGSTARCRRAAPSAPPDLRTRWLASFTPQDICLCVSSSSRTAAAERSRTWRSQRSCT